MLDLNELAAGLPAITLAFGQYLAEAGAVCFESQGHTNGALLNVQGDFSQHCPVQWPPVTDNMKRCLNDPEVATEHGAVGVAVLLTKKLIGYSTLERSRKGTGFDYWIGTADKEPFQNKARLEISGIRTGSTSDIKARLKTKFAQVSPSDGKGLPAYVVIVEFGEPVAEVRNK